MRRVVVTASLVWLLSSVSYLAFVRAQNPVATAPGAVAAQAKPTPTPTPAMPLAQLQREFKSLPFKAGEKLVYEVKFTRFPIAAKVGEVTFEYVGEAEPPGVPATDEAFFQRLDLSFQPNAQERYFRLRASAVSKGILIALFGIDVLNRYETLVDRQDFSARLHWRDVGGHSPRRIRRRRRASVTSVTRVNGTDGRTA